MSGINDQFKSAGKSLSQLLRKTTEVFNERWEELTAIQDRRREVWELAREREKLMGEMGAKVYSLHRRGKVQNRDLLSDCERIDTIGADIERLEHEIEELRRAGTEAQVAEVEVSDDAPIVDDDDIDTEAAEPAAEQPVEFEPEMDKEGTVPCAHAQAAAEGPAEDLDSYASAECEAGMPTMVPIEVEAEAPAEDAEAEDGSWESPEEDDSESVDFAPPQEAEASEPGEDDVASPEDER